jgi:hypothetical protein
MREWMELWYIQPFEHAEEVSKKLTGRWKILDGTLYLEIQYFLWKDWIKEDYLLLEHHTETINDCKK